MIGVRTPSGHDRYCSISIANRDDGTTAIALYDVSELWRAQQALEGAIETMIDPFVLLEGVRDDQGTLVDLRWVAASDTAVEQTGPPRGQMIGNTLLTVFPKHLDSGPMRSYLHTLETGEPTVLNDYPFEHELRGLDGRFDIRAFRAGPNLLALAFRDVTEQYVQRQALAESRSLYQLATEDVTDAVVRFDASTKIIWASPSFQTLVGRDYQDAGGISARDITYPDEFDLVQEALAELVHGDRVEDVLIRIRRSDSSDRWVSWNARPYEPLPDGTATFVAVARDVDDQVRMRQQLKHEIGHDQLTGLANSKQQDLRIERELQWKSEYGVDESSLAVLAIGIDRLADVNDAVSRRAGDLVIQTVAARIVEAVGDPDLVSRLAGDEFSVIVDSDDGDAQTNAQWLAERILENVRRPMMVRDRRIIVTVSVGLAAHRPGVEPADLLREASLALRAAKEGGRDRLWISSPSMPEQATRRLELEERLRQSLSEGALEVWFQPIVALADGAVCGYEALSRWRNADGEIAPPVEFIALAESIGVVDAIDLLALERSIALLRKKSGLFVSVNISTVTMAAESASRRLLEMIESNADVASRIRLELTETSLLAPAEHIPFIMTQASGHGVRWFADDFGSGFSSVSHLLDLPISGIKLDTSVTWSLDDPQSKARLIAQGLAALADGMGLTTVAEGVETTEQASLLTEQGWREAQGFLFGSAAPLDHEVA